LATKSEKISQAVILAGGQGRRLEPYTRILPKPLLPVGQIPIIEILLRQLKQAGIKEIILAVGYQADLIRLIIGDGSQLGLTIKYSPEKSPLGTVGPLKKIRKLKTNFLVLNGDLLTDLPFREFIRAHMKNDAMATIAMTGRSVKIDYGVIKTKNDRIADYLEKPSHHYQVSMGIYAFRRDILKFVPKGRFDFPDLVKKMIEAGQPPAVYKYRGRWYDIGRPQDWTRADRIFKRNPGFFLK
jgi:NDP-sugar pyrophosphorylase family protein